MANKADFSGEEWQQVVGGMFMAGVAVSAADPSGLWGMLKESFASGRTLLEAKSTAADNTLVKAIIADLESSEGRSDAQAFVKQRLQGAKADDLKQRAIRGRSCGRRAGRAEGAARGDRLQGLVAEDCEQCRGSLKGRRYPGVRWYRRE